MSNKGIAFICGFIFGAGLAYFVFRSRKDASNGSEPHGQSQNDGGEVSNDTWSELDRKRISQFLQNDEYTESDKSDDDIWSEDTAVEAGNVTTIVDDGLNVVGQVDIEKPTSTFIDINDPIVDLIDHPEIADESEDYIIEITSIEFVKAVASGKEMVSFIYDCLNKCLCWNFIGKPINEDEIAKYLGFVRWKEIIDSANLIGSVLSPIFLYNRESDVYIKIE